MLGDRVGMGEQGSNRTASIYTHYYYLIDGIVGLLLPRSGPCTHSLTLLYAYTLYIHKLALTHALWKQ